MLNKSVEQAFGRLPPPERVVDDQDTWLRSRELQEGMEQLFDKRVVDTGRSLIQGHDLEKPELISLIRPAFPVEPVPVRVVPVMDSDVPGERVADFSGWDSDFASTYRVFKGRRWDELTVSRFEEARFPGYPFDVYNFLTDEAFRYYLPAWLVLSVQMAQAEPYSLELLCSNATPCRFMPGQIEPSFAPRYGALSLVQKNAVAQVVRYAAEVLPATSRQAALEAYAYWRQFDPDPLPQGGG